MVAPSERQLAHHDRRQHGDRADRQVDPGRQDDERLGDGERADDRHLGEDRREVGRREEALGEQAEVERRRGGGRTSGWPAGGCAASAASSRARSTVPRTGRWCRRPPRQPGRSSSWSPHRPGAVSVWHVVNGVRGEEAAPPRPGRTSRRSAPAVLEAPGRVLDSSPSTGLSVISTAPVSKKSRPSVFGGISPVAIASTPSSAISSGNCIDVAPIRPSCDVLHARAPTVDRHDHGVAAGGIERQPGSGRGRLVDRVHEVDVGIDGEQVLHRRPGHLPRCRR